MYRLNFQDTIEHLQDFMGAGAGDVVLRDAKRAVTFAYRDMVNAHNWTYLYAQSRLFMNAPFVDGTIAYDAPSNVVTLTPGLSSGFPSWAATGGYIRASATANAVTSPSMYSPVVSRVHQIISPTQLLLDPVLHWPASFTSVTYSLYCDTYLLPEDFTAQDQGMYEWNFGGLTYVHPREWLHQQRYIYYLGTPQFFSITGSPMVQGRLEVHFSPIPQEPRTIDFIYKRRPKGLSLAQKAGGTVSIAAGHTVLTGTGTAFAPDDVGRLLRVSGNVAQPTSLMGSNPFVFETIVTGYTSSVGLSTLDQSPFDLTGVAYTLSDAIDIEPGAMTNAFLRCCEWQASVIRKLKDRKEAFELWKEALVTAKEADSRSFMGRAEGMPTQYRIPIQRMPLGPDVPSS